MGNGVLLRWRAPLAAGAAAGMAVVTRVRAAICAVVRVAALQLLDSLRVRRRFGPWDLGAAYRGGAASGVLHARIVGGGAKVRLESGDLIGGRAR
eukprot:4770054-Pleurochrysis_carterae.AAC.2